jgi:hypothetical protein
MVQENNMRPLARVSSQTIYSLIQTPSILLVIAVVMLYGSQVLAQEELRPYDGNPAYWQYQGTPILLIGGSERQAPFQWPAAFLDEHLDLLAASGGNYIRNIMTANAHSQFGGIGEIGVHQFKKLPDGRYDLDQWNEEYWNRLSSFLQKTSERGIIVSIEIWEHEDLDASFPPPLTGGWGYQPWNPKNNINYTEAATGVPEVWTLNVHQQTLPLWDVVPALRNVPQVLQYQEKYVKKLLEVSSDFDNVIFIVNNESTWAHAIGDYWANFVHNEAASMGRTFYITDMRMNSDLRSAEQQYIRDNPNLYNYLDISQNNTSLKPAETAWNDLLFVGQEISGNRPINNTKIYGADNVPSTSSLATCRRCGAVGAQNKFWMNLLGGSASARFHRSDGGLGLTPIAQNSLRAMQKLQTKIKMWDVDPRNDLMTNRGTIQYDRPGYDYAKEPFIFGEAYLAAQPGLKYALYFTRGGSVGLNLASYSGVTFDLNWINIDTGEWGAAATISGGSTVTITAPTSTEMWVAAIVRSSGPP